MAQIITRCRECNREIAFPSTAVRQGVLCSGCKKALPLRVDPSIEEKGMVRHCVSCGHENLYIQKDFNRNLGVAIVVVGSLASLFFFSRELISRLSGFVASS